MRFYMMILAAVFLTQCNNDETRAPSKQSNKNIVDFDLEIAGGSDASENPTNYLASVVKIFNSAEATCTGIIVSSNWVLTAHHCVLVTNASGKLTTQATDKMQVSFDRSGATQNVSNVEKVIPFNSVMKSFVIFPQVSERVNVGFPVTISIAEGSIFDASFLFSGVLNPTTFLSPMPKLEAGQTRPKSVTDAMANENKKFIGVVIPDDLALLKLKADPKTGKTVPDTHHAIRILDPRLWQTQIREKLQTPEKLKIKLAGFGTTPTLKDPKLQETKTTLNEEVDMAAGVSNAMPAMHFLSYQERAIENNVAVPKGVCAGDSGGPMLLAPTAGFSSHGYLIGVTSLGYTKMPTDFFASLLSTTSIADFIPCSQETMDNHTTYTNLTEEKYINWLKDQTEGEVRPTFVQKCGVQQSACDVGVPIVAAKLLKGANCDFPGAFSFDGNTLTTNTAPTGERCHGFFELTIGDLTSTSASATP